MPEAPVAPITPAANPVNTMTTWPGAWGVYKPSAAAIKLNFGVLAQLFAINVVVSIIQNTTRDMKVAGALLSLVGLVVSILLTPAQAHTLLASARGIKTSLGEAFAVAKKQAIPMLILGILTGLSVMGGLILFIIPGIIIAVRLSVTQYYLVDKGLSATEAMKASWAATKGNTGKVGGIIGVGFVLGLSILVLVGIYFTIMYSAATAILYLYLSQQAAVSSSASTTTPAAAPTV